MTIALHTLGCKVNQYDSQALLKNMISAGYTLLNFNEKADIYIINTCTVTHTGDKKSLQMIRRARRLNPAAFVAVCGCMPNNQANDKLTLAGADFIFDARKPDDLIAKLGKPLKSEIIETDYLNERIRAYIKIQDGCDRYCTYCIVPYVRGSVISRPKTEILAEVMTCLQQGVQEIVLTGIQVAAYGYDTGSEFITLPKLIKEINSIADIRLRLSSIDPWVVDDSFLVAVSDSPTLCSHFHLSLQSGSDKILSSMNRQYTVTDYANAAKSLRALRLDMALTTDIIVGFPGETDKDFQDTMDFAEAMSFSQIHVFEYSKREGTKAASLPNHVQNNVKSMRGEKMRVLASTLRNKFLKAQIGKTLPVLFETPTRGHTEHYCMVHVKSILPLNTIQNIIITGLTDNGLDGELT